MSYKFLNLTVNRTVVRPGRIRIVCWPVFVSYPHCEALSVRIENGEDVRIDSGRYDTLAECFQHIATMLKKRPDFEKELLRMEEV